jgi:MFS family permease
LTTAFTPALAATVAALWTDIVDWRFAFLQTIPLCSPAGILVWSRSMGTIVPFGYFLRDPRLMAVQKLFRRFLPKRMSGYYHYPGAQSSLRALNFLSGLLLC